MKRALTFTGVLNHLKAGGRVRNPTPYPERPCSLLEEHQGHDHMAIGEVDGSETYKPYWCDGKGTGQESTDTAVIAAVADQQDERTEYIVDMPKDWYRTPDGYAWLLPVDARVRDMQHYRYGLWYPLIDGNNTSGDDQQDFIKLIGPYHPSIREQWEKRRRLFREEQASTDEGVLGPNFNSIKVVPTVEGPISFDGVERENLITIRGEGGRELLAIRVVDDQVEVRYFPSDLDTASKEFFKFLMNQAER